MDIKTRGPTNAIYGMYGNGIIQRSISTQRTSCIEQVYEILPQDIKRQERKELEKIDASRPRTPYPFITPEYIKMVHFTLSSWNIWTQPYLRFAQSWVTI